MEREKYKFDEQMKFVQMVKNQDKNEKFDSLGVHDTMMEFTE